MKLQIDDSKHCRMQAKNDLRISGCSCCSATHRIVSSSNNSSKSACSKSYAMQLLKYQMFKGQRTSASASLPCEHSSAAKLLAPLANIG